LCDDYACAWGLWFPCFVDEDAESVESAPDDEVETGSVPQSAEEHGVHVVDVGAEVVAMSREDDVDGEEESYDGGDGEGDPEGASHESDGDKHAAEDEPRGEGGIAVAAEGDVEVVFEPVAE